MNEKGSYLMQHTKRLLDIMAKLRDPETGCPWDVEQTFASIVPCTIEEAYEVAEAIRKNDMAELRSELGDLLLQVVFYAQMAEEQGRFSFEDVAEAISDKLIKRHPHVFGDATIETAEAQTKAWEEQKKQERDAKAKSEGREPSILDDVALGLPGLTRAEKLQKRAARVGFDWPDISYVFDKLEEELLELREAAAAGKNNQAHQQEELGDLLFVCANLARHLGVNAEEAIRAANAKFERRFHYIEKSLREKGKTPEQSTLEEMDALWNKAKRNKDAA